MYNIGIDIDGVLTNYYKYATEIGEKFFGKKVVNPNGYYITELFDVDDEAMQQFYTASQEGYVKNPIITDFAYNLAEVFKKNPDFYPIFISGRYHFNVVDTKVLIEETYKLIMKVFGPNPNGGNYPLFLVPGTKGRYVDQFNIHLFIEDSVDQVKDIRKYCSVLIPEFPYNAEYIEENKNDTNYHPNLLIPVNDSYLPQTLETVMKMTINSDYNPPLWG